MGLDSGINIQIALKDLPSTICPWPPAIRSYDNPESIEICYLRKCYSIRDEVMEAIHCEDNGSKQLSISDLAIIYTVLNKYRDVDYFNDNDDCIWTFEEIQPSIELSLANILALIEYMQTHPDLIAIWYDSY